jgi:hypothetical protein
MSEQLVYPYLESVASLSTLNLIPENWFFDENAIFKNE